MHKKTLIIVHLMLAGIFILSACAPESEPAGTALPPETGGDTPTSPAVETDAPTIAPTLAATETSQPEPTTAPTPAVTETASILDVPPDTGTNILIAVPVDQAPVLDGSPDDSAWEAAQPVGIATLGGANASATQVSIRAVYADDQIFFLLAWADPTQSLTYQPWILQEDGVWQLSQGANNLGGDETEFHEDKLSFLWSIDQSIPNFEVAGCFTACHSGDNPESKVYGSKYTSAEGQLGDLWVWRSVRNVGQVDDEYVDSTAFSLENPNAGLQGDPLDSGGYQPNVNEAGDAPAAMPPGGETAADSPGHILADEAVALDSSLYQPGDQLPSVIVAPLQGDRGDIQAGWTYTDGMWILEIGRVLITGSEVDIQFDDLSVPYFFGLATFDNAQVRHAYQPGANQLVFQQP